MRSNIITTALLIGTGAALAAGCNDVDDFTPEEWALIDELEPLKGGQPPSPYDNMGDDDTVAKLGQMLFFDKRIAGPIQDGTIAEGQLGAIGEKYKIACSDCHQVSTKWLFDKRSNNGRPIPNATALGSAWMSRNVSSLVNTVFYVNRTVRVKCLAEGKLLQPAADLEKAFAGKLARGKSLPRLALDAAGGLWLLLRHHPNPQGAGEIWDSYALRSDGKTWSEPHHLPNSTYLLDSRPAVIAFPSVFIFISCSPFSRSTRRCALRAR